MILLKYCKYIYLLLILNYVFFLGSGCVSTNIEDSPWLYKSTPVVFSLITPDIPVQVTLSETFGKDLSISNTIYPEAAVYIKQEAGEWVKLNRHSPDTAIYVDKNNQLSIREGATYFLRVDIGETELTAQTTVPDKKGLIISAEYLSGHNSEYGSLKIQSSLPANNKYRCFLYTSYAFMEEVFLSSEEYIDPDFYYLEDNSTVSLITCNFDFEKYHLRDYIMDMQYYDSGDISVFLFSFGGVLPEYSNITNGTGLFGSYLTDNKTIETNKGK